MGSSLTTLRNLLARQIDYTDIDTTTDPSTTELDDYINKAIRKIARRDVPQEIYTATAINADTVANSNQVTIPSTVLAPQHVYVQDDSGNYRELVRKTLEQLISDVGANTYFDSSNNVGTPYSYAVQGSSLIFDRYFTSAITNGVKILGLKVPIKIGSDLDTELITNSTFDTDITGWNNSATAPFNTFEWHSGAGNGYLRAVQLGVPPYSAARFYSDENIAIVEGKKYKLSLDYINPGGVECTFAIASAETGSTNERTTFTDETRTQVLVNVTTDYTATTTESLLFKCTTEDAFISEVNLAFDNISVKAYKLETDLPTDYDMLIVYEAAIYFYQKDDDFENQRKYEQLAAQERAELSVSLSSAYFPKVSLDDRVFYKGRTDFSNPNVFYGPQ